VIDDDHGVRTALCNLLDSAGYRSCGFAAGEEFLAAACLHEAACAIVDLGLSCMSGFELAERLARLRPGLPVILMSARDGAAQRQRAAELDAAALLHKPFDAETLLARLRAILAAPGSGTMRS
jgi:DNA-binding response OmpR family regulator